MNPATLNLAYQIISCGLTEAGQAIVRKADWVGQLEDAGFVTVVQLKADYVHMTLTEKGEEALTPPLLV